MPVISNTSPLLNLAIVDHLFLLPQQFGQIIIPEAVLAELKINDDLPGSSVLKTAVDCGQSRGRPIPRESPPTRTASGRIRSDRSP